VISPLYHRTLSKYLKTFKSIIAFIASLTLARLFISVFVNAIGYGTHARFED
jgi:hypothetical protein